MERASTMTAARGILLMACLVGLAVAVTARGTPTAWVIASLIGVPGLVQLVIAGLLAMRRIQPSPIGRTVAGSVLLGTASLSYAAEVLASGISWPIEFAWITASFAMFMLGLRLESGAALRARPLRDDPISMRGTT